jgi:nucleoside-diphosphate-sugar epimerase
MDSPNTPGNAPEPDSELAPLLQPEAMPTVKPVSVEPRPREELIEGLRRAAPPGQVELDERVMQRLLAITIELRHHHRQRALETFTRFVATADRGLVPFDESARDRLRDKTILVTGGSGCIGSVLLDELAKLQPARLVSIARGRTQQPRRVPGVEYIEVDIRSQDVIDLLFADLRPTVVFHLAGQRDPELAERAVAKTISTNVFGTERLLSSARRNGVRLFVYASTGKALRLYTPDVYAASKKAGEWLVSRAGSEGAMACAVARFTHVVDNSLIRRKIVKWGSDGSPVHLHGPDVAFYVQSARESAQLLISAALEAETGASFVHAIRNLGEPTGLLDLALGIGFALERISPLYIWSSFRLGGEGPRLISPAPA